jgi:hypothetical protein
MSLENLYKNAAATTYVGSVRTKQAADVGAGTSPVNYFDGETRGYPNNTADVYQTEFKRNAANTYKTGGSQGILRSESTKLTRWTTKAFNLAFDNQGPASLPHGFYRDNRFRVAKVSTYTGAPTRTIHNYTPTNVYAENGTSAGRKKLSTPSGAPTL